MTLDLDGAIAALTSLGVLPVITIAAVILSLPKFTANSAAKPFVTKRDSFHIIYS